jgi:hypothetical protein
VDIFLPEYQYLQAGPNFAARIKLLRQALALPEETRPVLLEILRFLGTLALITVIGLIMLMAG